MKVEVCPRGTGGGQVLGPQSPHSNASLVLVTWIQLLATGTMKLKPYWLSVPPPLPGKTMPR